MKFPIRTQLTAIEIAIFAVVSMICLTSTVRLLLPDGAEREVGPLYGAAELAAAIVQREPAREGGLVTYSTRCDSKVEHFSTTASKLRIQGPICGAPAVPLTAQDFGLISVTVENQTTRSPATVFNNHGSPDFTTDFFSIIPGRNRIAMEFRYRNRATHPVLLDVMRLGKASRSEAGADVQPEHGFIER